MATYTVPTTGVYENSRTGGRFRHVAGAVIDLALAVDLGMPGAALPDVPERTATADGAGAGQIADGIPYVTVTSDSADKIITLPNGDVGCVVALRNGATGYELRSHDPETVAINGGTGSGVESAIPANTLTVCVHDTATSWLCTNTATDGSVSSTEAAA